VKIATMLRVVRSTLFYLVQGDAAMWLQQMAPNLSENGIHR